MNVKIPEAPMQYSKASVSTRQDTTVKLGARPASGQQHNAEAEAAAKRRQKREETAALLTTADLLLDLTDGISAGKVPDASSMMGDDSGVNIDLGRDRQMCSSPRLHSNVQSRLAVMDSKERRQQFIRHIVEEGSLTPRRFGEAMVDGYDDGVSSARSVSNQPQVAHLLRVEDDVKALPDQKGQPRSPQDQRPSSCFASGTRRFIDRLSGVPPVGHYNIRFNVVDPDSKRMKLAPQELPSKGSPTKSLDATMTSTTTAPKPPQPQHQRSSAPPEERPKPSNSNAGSEHGEEGRKKLTQEEQAKKPKPTSAFASKIPQLLSLKPPQLSYRDDATAGVYNETVLSTTRSPRGTIVMARTSPRNLATKQIGEGAKVIYNVDQGHNLITKGPRSGSASTIRLSTVDFDRQVGRDIHFVDGVKYSTFANSDPIHDVDASSVTGGRRPRIRDNDPGKDGTTLDFVTVDPVTKPQKGSVEFHKQTPRRPLHNPGAKRGDTKEEDDPKLVDPHKPSVNFAKMHRPPAQLHLSSCRVETYDIDPETVNPRAPAVDFDRCGSHLDRHSIFNRGGAADHRGEGAEVKDELLHPKVIRTIDIAKLPPRRDMLSGSASARTTRGKQEKKTAQDYLAEAKPPGFSGSSSPRGVWHSKTSAVANSERFSVGVLSSADNPNLRPRTTGNPFLAQHLSRADRAKIKEAKAISTSNRDYNVRLKTIEYEAEKKAMAPSRLSFDTLVPREAKLGGRLGAEYVEKDGPGPGSYNPRYDNVSPHRR